MSQFSHPVKRSEIPDLPSPHQCIGGNGMMKRPTKYAPMPRFNLKVGDSVRVKSGAYTNHCAGRVGRIISFLDDPKSSNNGAALVEIMTADNVRYAMLDHGVMVTDSMLIRPYIDTDELEVVS